MTSSLKNLDKKIRLGKTHKNCTGIKIYSVITLSKGDKIQFVVIDNHLKKRRTECVFCWCLDHEMI